MQFDDRGILTFNDSTGYPLWYPIFTSLMMLALVTHFFANVKCTKMSRITMMMLFLSSVLNSSQSKFLKETDEFYYPIYSRSNEFNTILLNATSLHSTINTSFDTDYFPIDVDSGASSTPTPHKSDFITDSYEPLQGVAIPGIASGLNTSGVGSVLCKIKYEDGHLIDLQIDRVLHLEKLPSRLISPQQVIRQSNNLSDGFHVERNKSKLIFHGYSKTVNYDPLKNIPMLFTESGLNNLHAYLNATHDSMIQDGAPNDNLTNAQRQLMHWHR